MVRGMRQGIRCAHGIVFHPRNNVAMLDNITSCITAYYTPPFVRLLIPVLKAAVSDGADVTRLEYDVKDTLLENYMGWEGILFLLPCCPQ
jgi:hypothetical protein